MLFRSQVITAIGLGLIFASLVIDVLYYNGALPALRGPTMEVTMVGFSLLQLSAVLLGTVRELGHIRESGQRLAVENTALERANALRGEMMSTLSHEIRTPLAVMSAYAQLTVKAMREGSVDEQTAEDMEVISREAKRLAEMASEFLKMSRDEHDIRKKVPLSIAEIASQTARLCAPMLARGGNSLEIDVEENLPRVLGNPDECTQIIWNLLSNASRHTKGGKVEISATCRGEMAEVSVRDNGEGIPVSFLPHVFERGRGIKSDGAGLGLSICKDIVEEHGGQIYFESQEREGTCVTFTLPVCREADEEQFE